MRSFSRCVIGSLDGGGGDWGMLTMPPGEGEVGGGGGGCLGEDSRVNSWRERGGDHDIKVSPLSVLVTAPCHCDH